METLAELPFIVQPNPPDPPLGVFKGLVRQWLKRRTVELEEEISAADPQAAHRPGIEISDELGDRLVQLGEREEPTVAQPRQDPALDHQHADFDFRLVARLGGRVGRMAVR